MEDIKFINDDKDVNKSSIELEGLSETDVKRITVIMNKFVKSYVQRDKAKSDEQWLFEELRSELPDRPDDELHSITEEIFESIQEFENNLDEINIAFDNGTQKETWLTNRILEASTGVSAVEYSNYLNGIDNAMTIANGQMMRTVTTNAGEISRCMNLDGFMAEQYAVNTFNMQAQLEGSKYRAEVLVPKPGQTYGLNSFDAVIKDSTTGKIVNQYQFKYGKDATATVKLLREGIYNNQRFVVPANQVDEVRKAFPGKSVEAYIGGTDMVQVKSKTLTKEEVKKLQLDTQERGVLPRNDWNTYNTKELALSIGKNAGLAGMQSAAITTGFDLVAKVIKGEELHGDETIELALRSGADSGIKAAAAGAIKAGAEKGIISIIPKGTPAGIIANIACLGIENVKIFAKAAVGEFTMSEALDRMGRTSTAMVYGFGWGTTGMAIGATTFAWIPFAGPIVGGIIGGMAGYMAGSQFGNTVYSGLKIVGSVVRSVANSAWSSVKSIGSKLRSKIFG